MDASQLSHLADLGLCVVPLCGPTCDAARHGYGHPPEQSGKIPLRGGWQRSGYRPAADLLREHRDGDNAGIRCGVVPGAPLSVAVVDGDDADAVAWMRAHLPPTPWRVRTRQGEHWYYRAPEGVEVRNRVRCGGLRIDVRAEGGQVVAPGSVHRTGHVYEVIGATWTPESAAALPVYAPAWLPAPGPLYSAAAAPAGPNKATGAAGEGAGAWTPPQGSSWPGERTFSRAEYERSFERALSYAERLPPSISGQDGHGAAYRAAVAVLRGFPLASLERLQTLPAEGAPVDAADAMAEALQVLQHCYNPRCVASDGQTPYPWSAQELRHKVEDAARADRLPGPDYWLFDAPPRRRASENEEPPSVAADEGSEINETDNTHKVACPMDNVNPLDILSLSDTIGGAMRGTAAPARPTTGAPAPTPAPAEWPEPVQIGAGKLPAWPAEVLRGSVAEYVAAVATATQTPIDMVGMTALGMLSAAARGSYRVRVTAGYAEQVCLYTVTAAKVAERKSAMRALTRPMYDAQAQWLSEDADIIAHAAELAELERAMADLTAPPRPAKATAKATAKAPAKAAKAAKTTEPDAAPDVETDDDPGRIAPGDAETAKANDAEARKARINKLAEEISEKRQKAPHSGDLIVEDVTPEALAVAMAGAHGRMALVSDEGGDVFRMMRGAYGDGSMLSIYLKSYDGDAFSRRRMRGDKIQIDRPALTVSLLTQPDTLRMLADRDVSERGLAARFMYCLPPSLVGSRFGLPAAPPQAVADAYAATIDAILEMSYKNATIYLSDEARDLWVNHKDAIERRLAPGGDLEAPAMAGWSGKLAGRVLRIAALLHLCDAADGLAERDENGKRPVSADAMRRAMLLTEYQIAHARAAFGVIGETPDVIIANRALKYIKQGNLRTFTKSVLHRAMGNHGTHEETVDPALRVLTDHGYVRRVEEAPGARRVGRPKAPSYEVHPSVFI